MPTYQYRCTECGHDLEAVQKFTDSALTECPNCGGQLRKVFNAVGVVFKGSGFYRTDSRSADAGANGSNGDKKADGKEPAAPAKEKAGASKDGGSGKEAAAKPAASTSTNGSSSGSSTPAKAAGS